MQAAKIKVHEIYAVKRDGKLTRFQVTAVVTRRVENHGNPHDYKSTVEGHYIPSVQGQAPVVLPPHQILGPYLEFEELAKQKQAADEAEAKRKAEVAAKYKRLWELLYQFSGLPQPAQQPPKEQRVGHTSWEHERPVEQEWEQPFRVSSSDIEIRSQGVDAMIAALELALKKAAA